MHYVFGSVKVNKHCLYWSVFSTNILVFKLYNSGPQIMPLFSDHLRVMASIDIGGS